MGEEPKSGSLRMRKLTHAWEWKCARSSRFHPALEAIQEPIDLQLAEGHVH